MNLRTLQRHWNQLGRNDPLGAILAHPERRNSPWEAGEFFQSGVLEINAVLARAESLHPLARRKRALDFGCGVGRLTQALAAHFDQVLGVDLSPAMIEHARGYNRQGARCEYRVNERSDLRQFRDGEFDFVYSSLTLQHMPPRFAKRYIAEFLRVLAPGGLLVFQLPSRRKGRFPWVRSLGHALFDPVARVFAPLVVMRAIPREQVVRWLEEHGGRVVEIAIDRSAGPEWESFRYLVNKAARGNQPSPTA